MHTVCNIYVVAKHNVKMNKYIFRCIDFFFLSIVGKNLDCSPSVTTLNWSWELIICWE